MALWTPALLNNVALWLDANDASTLTLLGQNVSQWDDKSGNNNAAVEIFYQPEYQEEGWAAGKPAVYFDGTDNMGYQDTVPLTGNAASQFIVFRTDGTPNFVLGTTGANNSWTMENGSNKEGALINFRVGGGTVNLYNENNIYYVQSDASLPLYALHRNGEAKFALTSAFTLTNNLTLVNRARAFKGWVAEVITIDGALSTEDRQIIEGYLAHKWGMEADLPDGHPYKVAAPEAGAIISVTVANAPDGARYRISNQTRGNAEIENAVVSGGSGISTSFIVDDGEVVHQEGDTITIDIAFPVSTTAKLPSRITALAEISGISAIATITDDEIYNFHGIDGSALTIFDADFVDDEIDIIVSQNFVGAALYAFYVHSLTFEQGIREWLGAFTAVDNANFRVNVPVMSIKLDNDTTNNVWQTDNVRIFRSDGARPVKHPTTGGGGIDVNWRSQVYTTVISTSAGVITGDIADVPAAVQTGLTSQGYTTARAAEISAIKVTTDSLPSGIALESSIQTAITNIAANSGLIENVPTISEFEARTLPSGGYFDPSTDIVANVALVDVTTDITNLDLSNVATSGQIDALNNISVEEVLLQVGSGLEMYDVPTRTELTSDKIEIISSGNINWSTPDISNLALESSIQNANSGIIYNSGLLENIPTNEEFEARTLPSGSYQNESGSVTVSALTLEAVEDIWSTYQLPESYAASGIEGTPAQILYFMQQTFSEFAVSGVTITVKKLDGTSTAAEFILDDEDIPTSRTRVL